MLTAKRINRTIKEEYLQGWSITNYGSLVRRLNQAVNHYNHKRRHKNLAMLSPVNFENKINQMNPDDRPKLNIYKPTPKEKFK